MNRIENGVVVELTPEEEAAVLERQAAYKLQLDATRLTIARDSEKLPIERRLDAIWKQLNYMQMNGQTDLIAEMDAYIQSELAILRKYPDP